MLRLRFQELSVFFLVFLMMTGCAHVISSEMRQKTRKDVSFPMVLQNSTSYIGLTVILGGVIIQSLNREDGTEIMVLETPLDYRGRPRDEEYTRGRFIARAPAYLDPEVYKKGRKVTLAGEIIGRETRSLGEIQYTYPVVQVGELHLWKEVIWYYPYSHYGHWYWYGHHFCWPHYQFYYHYW